VWRGFLYLVAVMDWASRKVSSWRVPNTMDVAFCVEALQEALARFGHPEIFNFDQGSQFTSSEFTGVLQQAGVRIPMDGRGRWMDSVCLERLCNRTGPPHKKSGEWRHCCQERPNFCAPCRRAVFGAERDCPLPTAPTATPVPTGKAASWPNWLKPLGLT